MKKLTLDYAKWRCGGTGQGISPDPEKGMGVGTGTTKLLNSDGYMCCLGQWVLQVAKVTENDILNKSMPHQLNEPCIFTQAKNNSLFEDKAIRINDNPNTTVSTKLIQLTQLCKDYGIELTLINRPDATTT